MRMLDVVNAESPKHPTKKVPQVKENLVATWMRQRAEREREILASIQQDTKKAADGGDWAVTDPNGLLLSTHRTEEAARTAATARRYTRVVNLKEEEKDGGDSAASDT